jgi:hypothetical protein
MGKKNSILYSQNDIKSLGNELKHQNAFILSDGSFFLAKGYTGCNPSHQLESSALSISRQQFGYDIKEEYNKIIKEIANNTGAVNNNIKRLHYLRSILVHFYGYALFARIEMINSFKDRDRYIDYSLIPNPEYYGKEVTVGQISTLMQLFELNDDGTLLFNKYYAKTSDEVLCKVLTNQTNGASWHI